MTRDEIQAIALASGFKLKPQEDGSLALNPYVFEFADRLISLALKVDPPAGGPWLKSCSPNLETCVVVFHGEEHHYRKECNNLKWGEEHD
jgi:hypothetical protein